ncbi:MAG: ribulokinase [Thermoguttaceae bacterium]
MNKGDSLALGLDFGTASVRALLVDLKGNEHGSAVVNYRRGQITKSLPGDRRPLPPDFALQHPGDWLESSARAVRRAIRKSGADGRQVLGVGVDFTSCTMLPALRDGTPLCLLPRFAKEKHAWPKLWKHHGAKSQTARINQLARNRKEPWLARYGGIIGLEWFFPKVLEVLENAPKVYHAAEVWLEAGDWFVWQLVAGDAEQLPRSTCQAGYKAMWNRTDGYPSRAFFKALHPQMQNVLEKMPGQLLGPGQCAGVLCESIAKKFGLRSRIPVSAAIIDAHAGVPGAGVAEPDTLVMVMGTSSCHMLNFKQEILVRGVAGVVADGILPGYFGYETGQAAVGDAFDWLRCTLGHRDFIKLTEAAHALPPGAEGVRCVDWFNGCRTPLMNGNLRGAFTGLALHHGPQHLYRALLEASACGVRWIVDVMEEEGVAVKRLVATGGLPHHNPLLMQIYADVLGRPIMVHPSKQGPALGAAILGVLAAGHRATGFKSASAAIRAMAKPRNSETRMLRPNRTASRQYQRLYAEYRNLATAVQNLSSPTNR